MIEIIEQYPVVSGVAIFLLGIIVAIIGFIIRRYFFLDPPKNSFTPNIHVDSLTQRNTLYAQIINFGNDPIKKMLIMIEWLQDGKKQQRKIDRFFGPTEDPVLSYSHGCEFLDINEKKKMASIPKYSDDGKVIFIVEGEGVNGEKKYKESFVINNEKK